MLHSCSEDLEVLLNSVGALPQPLVDTQIACAMLGQPLQMGYHSACEWLLNVPIDKEQTRSNWCKRPLSERQLHYAAMDVVLLPEMLEQLRTRLEDLGRWSWLEEDVARMQRNAQVTVAPEEACIPIADDVPFECAALIGCAVTTGVGAALNTVDIHPGQSVAVYGCGGVGLNILQGARLSGAHPIIAVDTDPGKMDFARQFGATHTIAAGKNAVAQIAELTGGRGADFVFEAVGLPAVQEEALKASRPGGSTVIVGVAPGDSTSCFAGLDIHKNEKKILGSLYGSGSSLRQFPQLVELYRNKQLKLDELISRRYRLDQINEAFADLLKGGVKRGVIVFD